MGSSGGNFCFQEMYRLLKDRLNVFMDRRHLVGEFYIESLPMRWFSSIHPYSSYMARPGIPQGLPIGVWGLVIFHSPWHHIQSTMHTLATLVFIKSSLDHVISPHRRPPEWNLNYYKACGFKPPFQPPVPQMSSRCLMLCNPDFFLFPDTWVACWISKFCWLSFPSAWIETLLWLLQRNFSCLSYCFIYNQILIKKMYLFSQPVFVGFLFSASSFAGCWEAENNNTWSPVHQGYF